MAGDGADPHGAYGRCLSAPGMPDLDVALAAHAALPHDAPIWLVNVKGAASPYAEDTVRARMRAQGFIDSKTASVSATLAATRYARRKS